MSDKDPQAILHDLIDSARACMMTTINADGSLASRPMACQETEFDGDVWFFALADSPKVEQVRSDPRVNLAYAEGQSWVSLSGRAEIVRDVEKNKELWNPWAQAWFQAGPDDPQVVLIKVQGESAEYWDAPSKPAQIIGIVRAKVTGSVPDVGDNEKVDLPS